MTGNAPALLVGKNLLALGRVSHVAKEPHLAAVVIAAHRHFRHRPEADLALVHVNPSKKRPSKALSREDISGILTEHQDLFVGYHDLNIVHHQDQCLVTMHLLMRADTRLEEAHQVCDHLEHDIKQLVPGATVNIHLEPAVPVNKPRC